MNTNKEKIKAEILTLKKELENFFIFNDDLKEISIDTVLGNEIFQRITDSIFEVERKYELN